MYTRVHAYACTLSLTTARAERTSPAPRGSPAEESRSESRCAPARTCAHVREVWPRPGSRRTPYWKACTCTRGRRRHRHARNREDSCVLNWALICLAKERYQHPIVIDLLKRVAVSRSVAIVVVDIRRRDNNLLCREDSGCLIIKLSMLFTRVGEDDRRFLAQQHRQRLSRLYQRPFRRTSTLSPFRRASVCT